MNPRRHKSPLLGRPLLSSPLLWLTGCILALLAAHPAQAASSKPRPGPPCHPIAALIADPAGSSNDPANTTGQPAPVNAAPINQDVCVAAHIYQVVQLADGTSFLDVCPATIPDAGCRFILLSLPADREEVGDLRRLAGMDIQLRGTLRPMHGRMGIYLTHARQLQGGPEKFRPNPRLLRDFDAASDHLAVRDPNLRPSGHHRSFMNHTLKEPKEQGPTAP